MKLTGRLKPPAAADSTRYRSRYLDELIDFGGEALTRAEVVETMRREGHPQPCIDRWLQGQELAARILARQQRITTTLVVTSE